METKTKNAEAAPGADDALETAITFEHTRQLVERDAKVAVSFFNAILTDPDLMDHMARFMHGRYINHLQSIKPKQ